MKNQQIVTFDLSHIESAIELLSYYYQLEKNEVTTLLPFVDYKLLIIENLQILIKKGQGIAILENGNLIGFMTGYSIDNLFGNENGIHVPVYGHAAVLSRRAEIEQTLYTKAAELWVNKKIFSHSVGVFAHDQELLDLWHQSGFGNRCVDAIREVEPIHDIDMRLQFEEITIGNASLVEKIHEEHNLYYRVSPIFMPTQSEDALNDLIDWLCDNSHRMFCAKYENIIAGYARFQDNGESLFSVHDNMVNITGLYVLPKYRNLGIGKALIYHIVSVLDRDKIKRLGVDYESINPKANRFWKTHFVPYTYSLTRRIDERIKAIENYE